MVGAIKVVRNPKGTRYRSSHMSKSSRAAKFIAHDDKIQRVRNIDNMLAIEPGDSKEREEVHQRQWRVAKRT